MNKIILLSDKESLPAGAFDFACMLNEQQRLLLTGVFLPNDDYWSTLYLFSYGMSGMPVSYLGKEDSLINTAIPDFEQRCRDNGIEYRVHDREYDDVHTSLKMESRFADMLLFSSESFYNHLDEDVSKDYTESILHGAECPVMIVPEHFKRPESVILAYDGTASSVYAIRQFAALLPGLASLETLLVYVHPDADKGFPEMPYIEELAARHFPNLTFLRLETEPEKYFATWLADRKESILVAGAQGRTAVSTLIRKSFVSDVIKDHLMPVFIAHR